MKLPFWLEQLLCKHEYPKEWCEKWGYKNCKKCWYIPMKAELREELLDGRSEP